MRSIGAQGLSRDAPAPVTTAFLCCLCGVCEVYACPLGLSPRRMMDRLKGELAAARQANPHRREDCQPTEEQKLRRVPLPRLLARLGIETYAATPNEVDWEVVDVEAVRIPLSQHTGAPARPVVTEGARVEAGQLVGEIPEGKLGARVHASISGRVSAVQPDAICIERS
jgi:Na+-translocating ferredoxin:NAD+ oxidoreductase RnfC subunit